MFENHHVLRRVLRVLAVTVLTVCLVVGAAPGTVGGASRAPLLGGFFVYATSSSSATEQMLDQIRSTGASRVVPFGTRVRPVSLTSGRPAVDGFEGCRIDGEGCVSAAARGKQVRRVLTYAEGGTWHQKQLRCGDRQVVSGDRAFTVLLLPVDGSGTGCQARSVDVVVLSDAATAGRSKTAHLLAAAKARGVGVFVGMPAPVQRSDVAWLPDVSYLDTLRVFTGRWMDNLRQYAGFAAVVGVYHHAEMPLSVSGSWAPVLDVYRVQARAAAAHLPGVRALVSPYADARRSSSSATPLSGVPDAARRIVDAASGGGVVPVVLAPQDGQGTGKVGAFDAAMAGQQVDAPSAAVAGAGTYKARYLGSTGDYMRQVVAGVSGRAEVWVNIELMAATTSGAPVCDGAPGGRGKASLERVRRQVGVASVPGVAGTVGFMWTPYVTCGPDSLLEGLRTFPSPTHVQAQQAPAAASVAPAPSASTAARGAAVRRVPDPVVEQVQRGLVELGYTGVGEVDGLAGPRTRAAVAAFQADVGHPVTGVADEVTLGQVRAALAARTAPAVVEPVPEPASPASASPSPSPAVRVLPPEALPSPPRRAVPSPAGVPAPAPERQVAPAGVSVRPSWVAGAVGLLLACVWCAVVAWRRPVGRHSRRRGATR